MFLIISLHSKNKWHCHKYLQLSIIPICQAFFLAFVCIIASPPNNRKITSCYTCFTEKNSMRLPFPQVPTGYYFRSIVFRNISHFPNISELLALRNISSYIINNKCLYYKGVCICICEYICVCLFLCNKH